MAAEREVAVLVGFESSGKSAVFRTLTGVLTGDEANFRGSTVSCRRANLVDARYDVVDTPGIRVRGDADTTRRALREVSASDVAVLVVRGTSIGRQLQGLFHELRTHLRSRRVAVVVTFADRAHAALPSAVPEIERAIGVPVVPINARDGLGKDRRLLLDAIREARQIRSDWGRHSWPDVPVVVPRRTLLDSGWPGRVAALGAMLLLFATPVFFAYQIAASLQGPCERLLHTTIHPRVVAAVGAEGLVGDLLVGRYGVLSLGVYSFVWAFPVVALIALCVAFAEESGLNDRITSSLDPVLTHVGLSGSDLIPVLTGFGCNVVAVHQSRACSRCTRRRCVSLIAFGSACSYQIGASISLFNVSGRPWLFVPYVAVLFVVGVVHARVWNGGAGSGLKRHTGSEPAFLQAIRAPIVWWRMRGTVRQFLLKAMPIFLGTCVVGALLSHYGIIDRFCGVSWPVLDALRIPREAAPGILFSGIRKDGLMVLNSGEGSLVRHLSAMQLFLVVYLASTWSPCLVTMWTIGRELGWRAAGICVTQQVVTALASAALLAGLFRL